MSVNNFFGSLLQAVGILIMILSGLCSGIVILLGGADVVKEVMRGNFSALSIGTVPLIFGGIPFLIGFGIYKLGIPAALPGDEEAIAKKWKIDQQNDSSVTFTKKDDEEHRGL